MVNKAWSKAFEQFDLSPAHGYMLRVVLAKPGITQKELAAELKLEKSTITRFVDVLQKKGLITRKPGDNDGREMNINPTQKAVKIHASLEALGDQLYQNMVSIFGKDDLSALVGQLREGADKMK